MNATTLALIGVVGGRFLVPLLIPRYPLPAVLAALILDAVDQTIFQAFGLNPPGYQGYDKAMDVYYLAIAYLSTLRNWRSAPAQSVASFLYFYRLVGVVAFELTHARALLLIFPNTFEYFFIAYEAVRLRWDPARAGMRVWVTVAAAIWILVKLPQEWWIHIARLDVTEQLAAHPFLGVLSVLALLAVLLALRWGVFPRLPAPDEAPRLAADLVPAPLRAWRGRAAWVGAHQRVLSRATAEKVALVGLIGVIFAQVLPNVRSTDVQLFAGLAGFVVINAAFTLGMARRVLGTDSLLTGFVVRLGLNILLVLVADALLRQGGGRLNPGGAVFFAAMLSLLTLLDDRFRPVQEYRRRVVGSQT